MFNTLVQLVAYLDKGIIPLTRKSGLLAALIAVSLFVVPSSGQSVNTIPLVCAESGTTSPRPDLYWSEARSYLKSGGTRSDTPTTRKVKLTAYTSEEAQTDSTPFITASNSRVRDGIVAANFLPFGTRIKIKAFGNKIFTVEDRMHPRFANYVDIWMPEKHDAITFGVQESEITILD